MSKTIEDKLREGRTYRAMSMEAVDDNQYIVEGYATTFGQPYTLKKGDGWEVREQVSRNAFESADMSDVIMQYDHVGRVFARKSNGTLDISEDDHGLHVRAYLGGTEMGRQLYDEIKGGYTTKMSFGFTVGKTSRNTQEAEDGSMVIVNTIEGISKLWDVSCVSLPANDATEISARADGEGVYAEALKELEAAKAERAEREMLLESIRLLSEV